jgi:RimJ/RimL family protein N-acetyltransferase
VAIFPEELITRSLELRAFSIAHVDVAFKAVTESRNEVRRWLWWAQGPLDEESYKSFVRKQAANFVNDVEWRYFIFDRFTTNLVGGCSIDLVSHGSVSANLGYWIRTSLTGQGLATHTAQLMTDAAFEYLPQISSVEISMDVANVASARIAQSSASLAWENSTSRCVHQLTAAADSSGLWSVPIGHGAIPPGPRSDRDMSVVFS